MAAVSLTRRRFFSMLAVSVTKIKLLDATFRKLPFSVVTTESVFRPVPDKLICEIDLGSHMAVAAFHCNTWPDAGKVPDIALPTNWFAFQMAAVLSATIVNALPFLVTEIPLLSPFTVTSPSSPFNVVTPPLKVPNVTQTPPWRT